VLKKFSANAILGVMSGLLGLLNYLIFIKYEGLEQLGIWATVSIVIVLAQFVEYGLTDGIFRKIATSGSEIKLETLGFISTSIIVFAIIGALLSLIIFFNMDNFFWLTKIDILKWSGIEKLYGYACVCILFSAISSCLRAVLYGLNEHSSTNLWMLISRLVQTASLIYFITIGYSYNSQVCALLIYLLLMISGCVFILNKKTLLISRLGCIKLISYSSIKELFITSKEMFLLKTGQKIFVDEGFKIILARYVGPEAVGAYSTAFNLAQLFRNMVDLGSKVLLNSTVEMSKIELSSNLGKLFKVVLLPLSCCAILAVLLFKPILQGVEFFSEFQLIYYYLLPLIIAYSINVFATPLYYVLIGTKQFKPLFQSLGLSIFILYGSSFLLINCSENPIVIDLFSINVIPYALMLIGSSILIISSTFNVLQSNNKAGKI
jgi:O-antigen/teichoic acid export membrane protein